MACIHRKKGYVLKWQYTAASALLWLSPAIGQWLISGLRAKSSVPPPSPRCLAANLPPIPQHGAGCLWGRKTLPSVPPHGRGGKRPRGPDGREAGSGGVGKRSGDGVGLCVRGRTRLNSISFCYFESADLTICQLENRGKEAMLCI